MKIAGKPMIHLGAALALSLTLLAQQSTHPRQTYVYKKVGDCEIRADVYRLQQDGVRPAILYIHGGALIFGHRGGVRHAELTRYLQAGFVVVSIDYRLAPETELAGIVQDVEDAYRWVRREGPALFKIDPDRVAVCHRPLSRRLPDADGGVSFSTSSESIGLVLWLRRHCWRLVQPARSILFARTCREPRQRSGSCGEA